MRFDQNNRRGTFNTWSKHWYALRFLDIERRTFLLD